MDIVTFGKERDIAPILNISISWNYTAMNLANYAIQVIFNNFSIHWICFYRNVRCIVEIRIITFHFKLSDKNFLVVGNGWCRPGGCNIKNSTCRVNAHGKLQSNYQECRTTCLNETSCVGFAISAQTYAYPNRCFVYGKFSPENILPGWKKYRNSYFDVHTASKHGGILCYRKSINKGKYIFLY